MVAGMVQMISVEEVSFIYTRYAIWIYTFTYVVPCLPLNNPNNGIIRCSLGDDNVTSFEDTCNFTCDTGYELTGSNTRTCQSDGNWSGSDDVCGRGMYVHMYIASYVT